MVVEGDQVRALDMLGGACRSFDVLYAALGSDARSDLVRGLGTRLDDKGCVVTDEHQRSSTDGLFAQANMAGRSKMAHVDTDAASTALVQANSSQARHDQVRVPFIRASQPIVRTWHEGASRLPAIAALRAASYGQLSRSRMSAGHQNLFAAALSFLPDHPSLGSRGTSSGNDVAQGRSKRLLPSWQLGAATGTPVGPMAVQAGEVTRRPDRWSADAWLLVREGGDEPVEDEVDAHGERHDAHRPAELLLNGNDGDRDIDAVDVAHEHRANAQGHDGIAPLPARPRNGRHPCFRG